MATIYDCYCALTEDDTALDQPLHFCNVVHLNFEGFHYGDKRIPLKVVDKY